MNKPQHRPWYLRIGPGLITVCVVIGPGSVLTSSQVGAEYGYRMNWIVIVAVVCMMVYMGLGAKLGAVTRLSPGTLVAQRAGRPLAVLIGLSVFLIAALFQFGNNMGAEAALNEYVPFAYWVVVLNALSLAFLFGFQNFYKALERLMMVFVAVMLVSFAANLALAGPNWGELLMGLVPNWSGELKLNLLGLVATTFVIAAAFLQPYLVQQKGWGKADVQQGLVDSRIGVVIMALITLMIVSTSATVFHNPVEQVTRPVRPVELNSVAQVGEQLHHLLGDWSQFVFCLGLFSAAYSSFLVNAMVGGFILSDGLGLGSDPHGRWPRILTAGVLLVGMGVALLMIFAGFNPVKAIVAAQALTVLFNPLLAGVLLWLTNLRSIMGDDRNGPVTNILAAVGLVLLLAMAANTAFVQIPGKLWPPPAEASPDAPPTESAAPAAQPEQR